MTFLKLTLIAAALFFLLPTLSETAFGQEFSLSKSEIVFAKGKKEKIEITSSSSLTADLVSWEGDGEYLSIQKNISEDKVILTLTAEKPTDKRILIVKVGTTGKPLGFTILPTILPDDLKLSYNSATALTVTQDKEIQINRNATTAIPDGLIKTAVEPEGAVTAFFINNVLTIKGVKPQQGVKVRLSSDEVELATLTVDVKEGVQGVSRKEIVLNQGDTDITLASLNLSLLGKNNSNIPVVNNAVCTIDNTAYATVTSNCEKITAVQPGPAYLLINNGDLVTPVKVTVIQKKSSVKLSSVNNPNLEISISNKSLQLKAAVYDVTGKEMDDQRILLDWSKTGAGSEKATLDIDNSTNRATLRYSVLPTKEETIIVKACLHGSVTECDSLNVAVQENKDVTNFRLLRVRFDMMDDQTGKDLFGKKAVDEYFIAKVRLFNAIRKGDDDFGNSILVYSESLQAMTAVDFREGDGEWQSLTEHYARNRWFDKKRADGTPDPNNITAPDEDYSKNADRRCERIPQRNFFVPYRPLTFEMVANTQDRRNERSKRSRTLLVLNGISTLASIVTSVAVPGPSSDLPLGLDKLRNLAIPGFEKLFPSMNEVQRQNIISMVMKPLEEIPFGSDITRIVFFPKRPMQGVIVSANGDDPKTATKVELRISGIAIADACAQSAVIKKTTP